MKLNNKGFAITAVLYGLLILFVLLVSSYLLVLSAKKDRVEDLTNEIEKEYLEEYTDRCPNINAILEDGGKFNVYYTGTYIFNITDSNSGQTLDSCTIYLEKDSTVEFTEGSLITKGTNLSFENQDCNNTVYDNYVASVNSITYVCE